MNQNINPFEKLFIVIDPMRLIQPALIKGEWLATEDSASLLLYCCIFDERFVDDEADQQIELDLAREWLERLAAPARDRGLNVELLVEWNSDWRSAILAATKTAGSDLVIKLGSRHSAMGRRLLQTSDLLLVQQCDCPILLVRGHRLWDNKKILAAIKLKPEDEIHEHLNEQLINLSHNFSTRSGFDLYAVTAYKGDDIYFDRQRFADTCGLPRDRVLSGDGAPERVIATVADELKADMIVIGNPGDGERNTAVLLIDQVDTDVLFLPQFSV